jgi:hypothetical protein
MVAMFIFQFGPNQETSEPSIGASNQTTINLAPMVLEKIFLNIFGKYMEFLFFTQF